MTEDMLIPEAIEAREKICEWTGLSEAAATNRALQIYALFEAQRRAGNTLIVRTPDRVDFELIVTWIGGVKTPPNPI